MKKKVLYYIVLTIAGTDARAEKGREFCQNGCRLDFRGRTRRRIRDRPLRLSLLIAAQFLTETSGRIICNLAILLLYLF